MSAEDDPWTIRLHHVGGIGEAGPLGVLSKLGKVIWTVYEAVPENATDSATTHPEYNVVGTAVGGKDGTATFYENVSSSSSSLLRTASSAKDYAVEINMHRLQVWGVHTQVRVSHTLGVRSLDSLVASEEAPPVDFLSIDAQGAELSIMEGAAEQLRNTTVGLVIEAEFAPLYEGQPLFHDTMGYLWQRGFRLCEILNPQYFYHYPYSPEVLQDGFLTVGEVVYLKEFGTLETVRASEGVRAVKLAAVAAALGRLDYAVRICDLLLERGIDLKEVAKRNGVKYIWFLVELWEAAKVATRESPPAVEANGGLGPQPPLLPAPSMKMPDGVTAVLLKYGFEELALKHMERVLRTRVARNGGWRVP